MPNSFYNPGRILNAWALDSGPLGASLTTKSPQAASRPSPASEPVKYLAEKAAAHPGHFLETLDLWLIIAF